MLEGDFDGDVIGVVEVVAGVDEGVFADVGGAGAAAKVVDEELGGRVGIDHPPSEKVVRPDKIGGIGCGSKVTGNPDSFIFGGGVFLKALQEISELGAVGGGVEEEGFPGGREIGGAGAIEVHFLEKGEGV